MRMIRGERARESKREADLSDARASWWQLALQEAMRRMVDREPDAPVAVHRMAGAPRGEMLSCLFADACDPLVVDVYESVDDALSALESVVARRAEVWETVQRAMSPIPEGAFHLFRFGLLHFGVCCVDHRGVHIVAGTSDPPDRMRAPRASDIRAAWEAKAGRG